MAKLTEKSEIKRLSAVYADLPPKKRAIAEGLIVEAARLRVRLDTLWQDINENGEVELFSQSADTEPYERERPASRNYTSTNKAYQGIIKQLDAMLPAENQDVRVNRFGDMDE